MFSARSFRPWAQNLRNLTVRAKKTTGRFYFRPGKIASLVGEMIRSPEMDEAEAVQGKEVFEFLYRQELAVWQSWRRWPAVLYPGSATSRSPTRATPHAISAHLRAAKGSSATSAGLIAPGSPGRCRSCSAAVSGM